MIQAVIFDLDGTVIDSNEAHVAAWDRAFRKFGQQFPVEQLRKQIGKGSDQYLPEFLTPEELRTMGPKIDEYRTEVFKQDYLPHLRPFPRVRELFERIKRDGKRIALASSGKKEEVTAYKKIAQIKDLIDGETTADDAESSKPEPDIFAAALQKLGNPAPETIVAVGDTPFDAEAAKKVGVATIALLCGGFGESELRAARAVAVYRDPADLLEHYDSSPIAI
jgi:HAD superfamily hydrolase (TIGR01549 family)